MISATAIFVEGWEKRLEHDEEWMRVIKLDIVKIDHSYEKRKANRTQGIWGMILQRMGETWICLKIDGKDLIDREMVAIWGRKRIINSVGSWEEG